MSCKSYRHVIFMNSFYYSAVFSIRITALNQQKSIVYLLIYFTYSKLSRINKISEIQMSASEQNQSTDTQESLSENTTHFGYKTIDKEDKVSMVAGVFHSVAKQYDVMNDLMSFGVHRLWKRFTIDASGVRPGNKVLDLAGGTGDLTAKFSQLVGKEGKVILADINSSMLNVGRDKLRDKGLVQNIEYVQANAQYLPFEDNTFDIVTIAFGLRNVTDKDMALRSIYRVLKPGGRLLVLEFSKPEHEVLNKAYDFYSFNILSLIHI